MISLGIKIMNKLFIAVVSLLVTLSLCYIFGVACIHLGQEIITSSPVIEALL